MKKVVSLLAVFALVVSMAAQNVVAEETTQNDDEQVLFLSLTKTAEPLKNLTTNLTVITEEEIKEKSANTLGDIIEGEIGISYKNNGPLGQTQSVFMRGASSAQTLVLVDGRRVNEVSLGGADFTAIPASMIEKVEIIRGSGAALYGTGAFGGVINVITKKADYTMPNTFSDEMSAALNNKSNNYQVNFNPYFSFGTFKTINAGITGSYANEKLSILLAPSLLSSDGYRPNSFYNSKNIFGKIGFKPTKNSEFVLSGQAYNADIGNPGSEFSSYTSKQFEDNNYLKLDYNTRINDFDIQVSGYNANYTRKVPTYSNEYYTINTGFKGNISYKEFLLGLEWDKSEFKQKGLDSTYTNIVETVNKNRETLAAYIQYIMTFDTIENLTLIPVLRGDNSNDFGNVVTPAISAIYKLTDEIKLSGNASKVWKAPTFNDLYYPLYKDDWYQSIYEGNLDLKPEEGFSYDLGMEYSKGKVTGMITVFYIDSRNLINWGTSEDPATGYTVYKPTNIDKAKQYGYEIGLKHNLSKEFSHKVNYTYTKAEDVKAKQTLAYIPLHVLNYMLTLKPASIEGLKLTLDLSYNTTIYANDKGDYLDDYCIVNLRADYQIMKYVSLWTKIDNLTNNDTYQLSYGYPMPGVTGTVGIDVKF